MGSEMCIRDSYKFLELKLEQATHNLWWRGGDDDFNHLKYLPQLNYEYKKIFAASNSLQTLDDLMLEHHI